MRQIREENYRSNVHRNFSDDMRINAAFIRAGLGVEAQYACQISYVAHLSANSDSL
jgi:hypothetical protein